jgi:glycosyltransferase involved in cell wall biosynthesis/GNAT superfamily N-acetyltransferase
VNIAWFTPLSTQSAIAEYSINLCAELEKSCDVTIWAAGPRPWRETDTPVIDLQRLSHGDRDAALRDHEFAIYNMGDNAVFHADVLEVMRARPGVCILHDRTYANFFASQRAAIPGGPRWYSDRMDLFYGQVGRRAADESYAGRRAPVWDSLADWINFSFVEEVISGTLGVLVHAADELERIRELSLAPVGRLHFPSYPRCWSVSRSIQEERDGGRLTLLTVGYMNPNKQIDRVIDILGRDSELRNGYRYVVIGPADRRGPYFKRLLNLLADHDLSDTVEIIAGYQPAEVIHRQLDHADVYVNLREPVLEGASASLLEQLPRAKPVLVSDAGFFSELPDDAVCKTPIGDRDALAENLRRLLNEPQLRSTIGSRGREVASRLTVERAAAEIVDFLDEVRRWRPFLNLANKVAKEFVGFTTEPPHGALARASAELARFAPHEPDLLVDIELRQLNASDEFALSGLFERNAHPDVERHFHPFPLDSTSAHHLATEPGADHYYGAFRGDRLLAFSMLRGWNEGFEIPSFGILVDRAAQGCGLGSRLTDFTIEQARRLGCKRVRLSVYASNPKAHQMYVARGFREQTREHVELSWGPDERIVMMKAPG